MKLVLASASLAAVMGLASVSEADAWARSGSFTTRRGTFYGSATGGCGGGGCSRSVSATGPQWRQRLAHRKHHARRPSHLTTIRARRPVRTATA